MLEQSEVKGKNDCMIKVWWLGQFQDCPYHSLRGEELPMLKMRYGLALSDAAG